MKLLLDQGLPRSTAPLLRGRALDAVHAAEAGLADASDAAILSRARAENRTVVTLDADFHALVMVNRASAPSVIRIRAEGLKAAPMADLIESVLDATAQDLEIGALVTATRLTMRVHRLR